MCYCHIKHVKTYAEFHGLTGGFHQMRATNYANLSICIRFVLFFAILFPPKNQYVNERNECERMQQMQRKDNAWND